MSIINNISLFLIGWFMVFNATFNNIQLNPGGQFYWERKSEYPEKQPTCRKSLTKFIIYCCIDYTSSTRVYFNKWNNFEKMSHSAGFLFWWRYKQLLKFHPWIRFISKCLVKFDRSNIDMRWNIANVGITHESINHP
jgi:hypothetical protein